MRSAAHALAVPLAKSGEAVKAGPVGLVVILLLCVASYFLFRSMSKHLRTVRENFPDDASRPAPGGTVNRTAQPTATPPPAVQAPAVQATGAPDDRPGTDERPVTDVAPAPDSRPASDGPAQASPPSV